MISALAGRPLQLKIYPLPWLLFFILLGFGLRLQQLSFQPLWGDEGWSFYFATAPLLQLLHLTALDIHPPLYYILLKSWFLFSGVGAEEARFFSVMAGTLLIPLVGRLGQYWFDKPTGVIGAGITAVAPLAIYYSQEVRMYGLVTLLGAASFYFFTKSEDKQQAQPRFYTLSKPQLLYVLTTTAALYTHYYAIFLVFGQGLYLLLRHGRQFWRRQLILFIAIGLLYLPWVLYVSTRLAAYVENKRNVEGYAPLGPLHFVGDHLIAFSLGHLPAELQPYLWVALPFVLLASLGLIVALYQRRKILLLYLLLPLLLGYLINQIYPFTPNFYERTLLLVAPAYWLLLAAGIAWLGKRHYLFSGIIALILLLAMAVSLFGFYSVSRYPHEDYRPLLQDIAARATPADTILASYQWQLGFYQAYLPAPKPQLYPVPGWGRDWSSDTGSSSRLRHDLEDIFARSPRLWFPAYQASGHIWEDEAEAAMAQSGYPALLQWYTPQTKLLLAGASQSPLRPGIGANFDNRLTLLEATVGGETYQAGRDIIPIKLTWRKDDYLGSDYWVTLRLVDDKGYTWATRDSHPQAGLTSFTAVELGEILQDQHGLLTPAGAPPDKYRLLLSVRRLTDAHPLDLRDEKDQPLGAELLLAEIELVPPEPSIGVAALPVQYKVGATFNQQLHLVGYSLPSGPFKAGEALPLTLFWESLVDHPGPMTTWVGFKDQAGETVVTYQQAPIWPTAEWRQGNLLRDPYSFSLPPTLPPGEYELMVALLTDQGERLAVEGTDQIQLTTVATVDRPHSFEAPAPQITLKTVFGQQAKLVGLDLPQTQVKAGESLPLTLYWQALAPFDKSWKVFVHLTDQEGQIISQQDQIPGGGQFPTTGWVPNEYLVDHYNLLIPADTPPGQEIYLLKIGFYDANDFSRLPVTEGTEAGSDHLSLESWPISVE